MKKTFLLGIVLLSLLLAPLSNTFAQTPKVMSYQGSLYNTQDNTPINGTFAITFEIYDAEFGGNQLWSELQNVTVSDGLINVYLGSENPLNLPFDEAYWLQITIGNGNPLPRSPLTMVPYAGSAETANLSDLASFSDTTGLALDIEDGVVTLNKLANETRNVVGGDVEGTLPVLNIVDGAITEAKLSPNVRAIPKGPAGGDLTGQYPDPLIAEGAINTDKLQNGSITLSKWAPSTSGVVGTIIGWNGSSWIETVVSDWEIDGVIGNEVHNATTGGGLVRAGMGTNADPYTLGIAPMGVTNDMLAGNITPDKLVDGQLGFDKLVPGNVVGQVIYWDATNGEWAFSQATAPNDDQILRWIDNGVTREPQWTDEEGLKIPFAYEGTSSDALNNPQTMIELVNTNGQNDITAHGVHVWMKGTGGSSILAQGSGIDQNRQTNLPVVDIEGDALLSYQDGALNVDVDINTIDGGDTKGAMVRQDVNSVNVYNSDALYAGNIIENGRENTYHTGAYIEAEVANLGGNVSGTYTKAMGAGADINVGVIGRADNAGNNFGVVGLANESRSDFYDIAFPADLEAAVAGFNPGADGSTNDYGVWGQINDGVSAVAGVANDGYAIWGQNNSDTDATGWFNNQASGSAVNATNSSVTNATIVAVNDSSHSAVQAINDGNAQPAVWALNQGDGAALWALGSAPAPAIGNPVDNTTDYVAHIRNTDENGGRALYVSGGQINDQNGGLPIFADGADEDDAALVVMNPNYDGNPWATAIKTYGDIWANSTIGADVLAALSEVRVGPNPAGVPGTDYMRITYVPGTEITLRDNDVRIEENLFVDKDASIAQDLTVGQDLTVNGAATFAGPVDINGLLEVDDLLVNNTTTLNGLTTANAAAIFNSTVDINDMLTVNAMADFNDDVDFAGSSVEFEATTELVTYDALAMAQGPGTAGTILVSQGAGANPAWNNTIPELNVTTVLNTADLNVTGDAVFTGTFDATGLATPALFTDIVTDGIDVDVLLNVDGDALFNGSVTTFDLVNLVGTAGDILYDPFTDQLDITNTMVNFNTSPIMVNGTTNDAAWDVDITGEVRIDGGAADPDYDLLVSGDAAVTDILENWGGIVNTNAGVNGGIVTVADDFQVTGTSNLQGDVDADANVNIDGNLNVEGVITDSDGITNIDNALDVNGNITDAADDLVTVDDNFQVTGTSNLQGNVDADANVNVDGNLNVEGVITDTDGITNIDNALDVNGNITDAADDLVTVDDNFQVTGTSNLQGDVDADMNVNVDMDLTVAGNSTFGTAAAPTNFVSLLDDTELRAWTGAPGNPTSGIDGDLLVSRGPNLNPEWSNTLENLTVENLFVDDKLTLGADGDGMDDPILEVLEGDVVIGDLLGATGGNLDVVAGDITTIAGSINSGNNLNVTNNAVIGNNLNVTGVSTLGTGNAGTDLIVDWDALIENNLNVANNLDVDGVTTLDVTTIDEILTVNAATDLNGTLNVQDQATFQNDVLIEQDLTVNLESNLQGNVNAGANVNLTDGNLTISGPNTQILMNAVDQSINMTGNNAEISLTNPTSTIDIYGTIVNTDAAQPVLIGDNARITGSLDVDNFMNLSDNDQVNEIFTSLDGDLTIAPVTDEMLVTALAVQEALGNIPEDGSGTTVSDKDMDGRNEVNWVGTLNEDAIIDAGAFAITFENFVGTQFTVDGNTAITGTLENHGGIFNGSANFGGQVAVTDADGMQVTGVTNLLSDLDVVGNTTLDGNVDLGDAAADLISFNGVVDTDIIPNVDATHSLGSNANRWADVFVDGASLHLGDVIGTELLVGYDAGTNTATFNVDGDATNILELTTAQATITGNAAVTGTLNNWGGIFNSSANLGGNVQVTDNFVVTGTSNLQGDVDIDSDLTVDGNTTLGDDNTADLVTINGGLNQTGNQNVNLNGNVNAAQGLDVIGASTFAGTIDQTGGGDVNFSGNVDAELGLDVTNADLTVGGGNFTVDDATGNTVIGGTTDAQGTIFNSTGAVDISDVNGISITGNTTVDGTFTQTDNTNQVTFQGNVDAQNGLDVTNADLTVGGGNFIVDDATGNVVAAGGNVEIREDGTLAEIFIENDANVRIAELSPSGAQFGLQINDNTGATRVGVGFESGVLNDWVVGVGDPVVGNVAGFEYNGNAPRIRVLNAGAETFQVSNTGVITSANDNEVNIDDALQVTGQSDLQGTITNTSGANDVVINDPDGLTITAPTSVTGLVNQSGGQVTFGGNVDADNGLDVTNDDLTVGANFSVDDVTGNTVIGGTTDAQGTIFNSTGAVDVTDVDGFSVTAPTTIAGTLNQTGAGQVTFSGNVDADAGLDVAGNVLSVETSIENSSPAQPLVISDADGVNVTSGTVALGNAGTAGSLVINDGAGNTATIQHAAPFAGTYTLTLPVDDGTVDQVLTTDGAGILSWKDAANTLQEAYDEGNTISVTGGNSVEINNTGAGATSPLQITHEGGAAGISVTSDPTATGTGLSVNHSGTAGNGVNVFSSNATNASPAINVSYAGNATAAQFNATGTGSGITALANTANSPVSGSILANNLNDTGNALTVLDGGGKVKLSYSEITVTANTATINSDVSVVYITSDNDGVPDVVTLPATASNGTILYVVFNDPTGLDDNYNGVALVGTGYVGTTYIYAGGAWQIVNQTAY